MNLSLSSSDLSMQAADAGINLSGKDRIRNRIVEVDILDNNYTDNRSNRIIDVILNNFYSTKNKVTFFS